MCVCVCVCVLDLIRCFLLHKPHFIHSMSVSLAPYARAKGCTCAQGGLGPQLPTADHSEVSEWCTHSTLSTTTNNQQPSLSIFPSIGTSSYLSMGYNYVPYPHPHKSMQLVLCKNNRKRGVLLLDHTVLLD